MNPNHLQKKLRTHDILLSLKKLDYLTRSQLQEIHNLGGARNANRILQDLGYYVSHFRNGLEKVYYLNAEGRAMVGTDKVRKKTQNVDHFLLRNQFYIYLNKPQSWRNEPKVILGSLTITPDAVYHDGRKNVFVEVDINQSMTENRAKIERYKALKRMSKQTFCLVFVTLHESRRKQFNDLCKGLDYRVYTFAEVR